MVLSKALPDFGLDNLLNGGDIAVLGDSYWSRRLVLCGQLVEKDLIEIFVFKLTNECWKNLIEVFVFKLTHECWKTYSENYGES